VGTGFSRKAREIKEAGPRCLSNPVAEQRFREIVPPLLDDAYTLAKWLSQSPTDAEDIVQDAALRALQALSTVSVDRPKPWFLAIVRNAAMTFLARNRRRTVAYIGDMADLDALDSRQGDEASPNPEQELIAMQDGERLRQAIASLPSPFLETLVMRDLNGLSYREIAEATEAPVGTVMSRLARARAMLAKILRSEP
jgi:RNA polymerase sigma factor (sigma-70 family)